MGEKSSPTKRLTKNLCLEITDSLTSTLRQQTTQIKHGYGIEQKILKRRKSNS